MLQSFFKPLIPVALPSPVLGRQHYMHAFDIENPSMPEGCEDYEHAVRCLVASSGRKSGTAYLTIDEKIVKAGATQRKPGPHVDGCFQPELNSWGGGGGWNHTCNIVPFKRMSVIVASDFAACKAWTGSFDGQPKEDGDLSHLDLGDGELLEANFGYQLSPDCVHESLPMEVDTPRTFIRIALPVQ